MDNLGQTTQPTPLPEDLKARVDAATESLYLTQAEDVRMRKIVANTKDTLVQLLGEKDDAEKKLAYIKQNLEDTITKTADSKVILNGVNSDIETAKKTRSDLASEVEDNRASMVKKSADLDARETTLSAKESDFEERQRSLIAKELAHEARVAKLKTALE